MAQAVGAFFIGDHEQSQPSVVGTGLAPIFYTSPLHIISPCAT